MKPLETIKDVFGRAYDAAKFKPRFDKARRWINRRAGRKKKDPLQQISTPTKQMETAKLIQTTEQPAPAATEDAQTTTNETASAPPVTVTEAGPAFADIDAAANAEATPAGAEPAAEKAEEFNTTTETIIGIVQTALVLIGDDEGVLSQAEKTLLRRPLQRVLDKYNIGADALPAEVDLAVALAIIVITRLKRPKTATAYGKVKAWIGEKIAKRRGKQLAAKVEEATK